jgi:hypothetical protein
VVTSQPDRSELPRLGEGFWRERFVETAGLAWREVVCRAPAGATTFGRPPTPACPA